MTPNKFVQIALLASIGVLSTAFAASAAPNAMMSRDANVYKSNSSSSPIVNDVEEDDEVTVTKCTTYWCFIKIPGPDGWVRKKYLYPLDEEGEAAPDVPFNFGITVGPSGPSISFGIGDAPPPPPPPPAAPMVCFYKGNNFTGASTCENPGTNEPQLVGSWNDSISSIKITGGAGVQICQDWFYGGGCTNWNINVPVLNGFFNDQISSYQVY